MKTKNLVQGFDPDKFILVVSKNAKNDPPESKYFLVPKNQITKDCFKLYLIKSHKNILDPEKITISLVLNEDGKCFPLPFAGNNLKYEIVEF